jgi:hypothetical protein
MRVRPLLCTLLVAPLIFASAGCALFQKKKKEKPVPRVGAQPVFVGTVALVNSESGFALIDNGLLPTPPAGLALTSFTQQAQSAELVASDVQKRPFIIADIKSGTPLKGDKVFTSKSAPSPSQSANPGVAPAPQLPPAPEFLPPVQLAPAS